MIYVRKLEKEWKENSGDSRYSHWHYWSQSPFKHNPQWIEVRGLLWSFLRSDQNNLCIPTKFFQLVLRTFFFYPSFNKHAYPSEILRGLCSRCFHSYSFLSPYFSLYIIETTIQLMNNTRKMKYWRWINKTESSLTTRPSPVSAQLPPLNSTEMKAQCRLQLPGLHQLKGWPVSTSHPSQVPVSHTPDSAPHLGGCYWPTQLICPYCIMAVLSPSNCSLTFLDADITKP